MQNQKNEIKHELLTTEMPENEREWIYGTHYITKTFVTYETKVVPTEDEVDEIFD